ncbi:MAG: hypothetical protein R2932_44405 [Caldilineaceae bacterium]
MNQFFRDRRLLHRLGGLVGLAMALAVLGYGVAYASCGGGNLSDFCSSNFGLTGNISAVGSPTSNTLPAVDQSQLAMAGPLFYTASKALEEESARSARTQHEIPARISPLSTEQ